MIKKLFALVLLLSLTPQAWAIAEEELLVVERRLAAPRRDSGY